MKRVSILKNCAVQMVLATSALLLSSQPAIAQTVVQGGNVINQTWTAAGNPYQVQGDITIPAGSFLTVQQGTIVEFASTDSQGSGEDPSRVEIIVKGSLVANGAVFQGSQTNSGEWYGVELENGAVAQLDQVTIEDAVVGISMNGGTLTLTRSTVSNVQNCGVSTIGGSASIDATVFTKNGTGVCIGDAGLTVTNSVIRSNFGNGITIQQASGAPVGIINSTIHSNGGSGVSFPQSITPPQGYVAIYNTLITQNRSCGVDASDPVTLTYNDVWGNLPQDYCSSAQAGTGSMSLNPLYVSDSDLHLQSASPVVDQGTSTGAPNHDMDGNPRPSGASWDIGAYEVPTPPPPPPPPPLCSNLPDCTAALQAALQQVKQLQDQVTGLQSSISSDNQQIVSLQSLLTAANQQVSNLDAALSAEAQQVVNLQSSLAAANQTISNLQSTNNDLVRAVFGYGISASAATAARDFTQASLQSAIALVGQGNSRVVAAQRYFNAGASALASGNYAKAVLNFDLAYTTIYPVLNH